jgi:putative SOS response-associated peptidase YedK
MCTCDPNELVAPIHPKAMITILPPEDHERWLTCPGDEVLALQRPYPLGALCVADRAPRAGRFDTTDLLIRGREIERLLR